MRVVLESQTFLLVLNTAEIPQNLSKARILTKHLWHKNQLQEQH